MRNSPTWILLLIFASPLYAVDPSRSLSQYMLDNWQKKDGLPQNSVNTILQTRDGYLWFGTQEGLVRFDGMVFRVFDKFNTPSFRHNMVAALAEDDRGRLWIATRNGLISYSRGSFDRVDSSLGLTDHDVRSLCVEGKRLWIGTDHQGVFVLEEDRVRHVQPNLPTVNVLCATGRDSLWIGTQSGLYGLFDDRLAHLDNLAGIRVSEIRALWQDHEGTLWIGTYGGGAVQFLNGRFSQADLGHGSSDDLVISVRHDRDRNVWIGTDGAGIIRWHRGAVRRFTVAQGLAINVVISLQEDQEGNLWIGTGGAGIQRVSDGKFVSFTERDGLPYDMSWSVLQSRDDRMWIGTDGGGVASMGADGITTVSSSSGLPNNVVMSLHEGADRRLWAGTRGGGVAVLDGKTIRVYDDGRGLASNVVRSITTDGLGRVWIGTESRGVSILDHNRWTTLNTANGLPSNSVRALVAARGDTVWIGTNGGLVCHTGGTMTVFDEKHGLSNPFVRCLHQDNEGVWWVGTFGGGLNRFKEGRFSPVRTSDGLFDDVVFSIVGDDAGYLWLTSNRGVFRVALAELRDFADGRIRSVRSLVFDEADGMKSSECNGGSPGAWRSRDGRLWFATVKGISVIDPQRMRFNNRPPAVVVEEMIVDGETVDLSGEAILAPGSNRLEIHYTGLSYVAPRRVRFKYMLEGFDQDWVDAGARRTAFFTNIPPGQYRFHVQACNNDGFWNTTGATLVFDLRPYIWQTWWFQLLGFLAVSAASLAAYRIRVRHLATRQKKLERLVTEKTQQLADQKVALEIALRDLKDTQAQLVHSAKMSSLVQLVSGMAHEINNPMAVIHGNLPHLEDRIDQMKSLLQKTESLVADKSMSESLKQEAKYAALVEDTSDIIRSCYVAVERIKKIILNLRNFSRLEEADLKEVDIHEGLESAVQFLSPTYHGEVTFHQDFGSLPRLSCFAGQLNQVFMNLIQNAADSVEERNRLDGRAEGHVWIQTRIVNNPDDPRRKWIQICVKDDGMGIPEEHRDKLFDPFFTTKPVGSGTGLGLSISYGIVQKHNGRIYPLFSDGQGGVEFVVELPA